MKAIRHCEYENLNYCYERYKRRADPFAQRPRARSLVENQITNPKIFETLIR